MTDSNVIKTYKNVMNQLDLSDAARESIVSKCLSKNTQSGWLAGKGRLAATVALAGACVVSVGYATLRMQNR